MATDPNAALLETLLKYAVSDVDPGYAVLVTGSWGIGKTYLIERFRHSLGEANKSIYISLYGVSSKDDFDAAILNAVYPVFDSKLAKASTAIGASVLSKFGFNIDLKASEFLNTAVDAVFVFDDLERISEHLPIQTVMGYLNRFIEHAGRRVIIICNDDEIRDPASFQRTKEKLVGRTLRVKPSTEQALQHFFTQIENESCKGFLTNQQSLLMRLYDASDAQNLRVLQQALWDFESLYSLLEQRHAERSDSLVELFTFFFVVALEAKTGRLTASDLLARESGLAAAMRRQNAQGDLPDNPLEAMSKRYDGFYPYNNILSNRLLVATVFDVHFDKDAITQHLNSHHKFSSVDDEPEWRILRHGVEVDDELLEVAAARMEEKYATREYEVPGVLLHVFTQRVWLQEIGFLKGNLHDVVQSAKDYIDHLLSEDRLRALDTNQSSFETDAYDSLGYHGQDEDFFAEIYEHLKAQRIAAFDTMLKSAAVHLLDLMESDNQKFVHGMLHHDSSEDGFSLAPILAKTDPAEFAERAASLSASAQHQVFMALRNRYKHGRLERELADEFEWLKTLRHEFDQLIAERETFSKDRLSKLVQWYLDSSMREASKASAD